MCIKYLRIAFVIATFFITTAFNYQTTDDVVFTTKIEVPKIEDCSNIDAKNVSETSYTYEDLDLLARLINCECGSNWLPDEFKLKVGNVVLNRVKDERFPDSIYEVVYQKYKQKYQYYCVTSGAINNPPSEKSIEIARRLLDGELILPENVVWQSEFKQGNGIYDTYYDEILGTTTYFCY